MARLAVRKVRYEGKGYRYESPRLKDGMNILVGPNGSGKSTLSNLIYFGLSGHVEILRRDRNKQHKEIVSDSNNYVDLTIDVNGDEFVITRYIGSNDIAITKNDTTIILPIFRGKDTKTIFSDWLLEKLDIKPIQLQLGTYAWQLNIRDLLRLIYHDQALDPSDVYKSPDGDGNFVVESKVLRKAIFEILVGKSFQDYYSKLAECRDLERQKNQVVGALGIFKETLDELQQDREDLNVVFIDRQLAEMQSRLHKLVGLRRSLVESASPEQKPNGLTAKKQELLASEIRQADLLSKENDLIAEVTRLQRVRATLVLEVTQIKKMIFAHEQLRLFSPNTCPYCLREVTRSPQHCVCGADVDEKEYERFFYEADEYLKILKTKQKNVDTIDLAIADCDEELEAVRAEKLRLEQKSEEIKERIKTEIGELGLGINISKFNEIDDLIIQIKSDIASLEQQRELEVRRENLEAKLARISRDLETSRNLADQLERRAEQEMHEQRSRFSDKYNELMRATVKDCRYASIDLNYMPVINAGEYKEASSSVPRRLMYYATLLYLSKQDPTIRFPRFLLLDTPDTAGIDKESLINSLSKLVEVVEGEGAACQVILTTGEGKYPQDNEADVFCKLTHQDRLLIKQLPENK